jgi:transposase
MAASTEGAGMKVSEREVGDVAELTRRTKSERRALQRDRYRATLLALEGKEAVEIAQMLGRSRRSVQDWVYWYRNGGVDNLLPGKSPGRPTKLPREREAEFKTRLDAGPTPEDGVCTLRGKDAVLILEREFGAKYSLDGAYDLLERLGYSCLSPRPRHEKSDPQQMDHFKERAPALSRPSESLQNHDIVSDDSQQQFL